MEKAKQVNSNLLKIRNLINDNLQLLKNLYDEVKIEDNPQNNQFKLKKELVNHERLLGLVSQIKKIQ